MKLAFKIAFLLFFTSIINVGCNFNNKSNNDGTDSGTKIRQGEIITLTPQEFKEKYPNNTIVDIRTPYEFKQGYIKGAININYYSRNFTEKFVTFDKNKPIYIYCRSGSRTSSAARKLVKAGFQKVYNLRGGIINWARSNNQIEK
jgi:rhodanese-related sulfurtransferase